MQKNDILEVLQAFSASSATLLHFEEKGVTFTLDKTLQRHAQPTPPIYAPAPVYPEMVPMASTPAATAPSTPSPTETPAPIATQGTLVKAQLVGVYYSSPTPDSPDFVSVGQPVKQGDTLCIIEAMKVMNEIKAPVAGTVRAIHVNNGELVEFDQVLVEIG